MNNQSTKHYFWEVRKFSQGRAKSYDETSVKQERKLYIFKRKAESVIVRLSGIVEKIHCWNFKGIEVLQKLNDNLKVYHWKAVSFPAEGSLILTQLPHLNLVLKQDIRENIPRPSPVLEKWIKAPIDDVFLIDEKKGTSFGGDHSLILVKTIYRTRFSNYYESRGWISQGWQPLVQISNSYAQLLADIDSFICQYDVVNSQKYENMFELHQGGPPKQERNDPVRQEYENKIMLKYHLNEYID